MTAPNPIGIGLLAPQSVAIVGASDDPSRTTGRPLAYLRRTGWPGRVYPVNPRRSTVQGEPAWPSLDALPESPDHALILLPTGAVRDAVEACANAKVRVASVLAAGFSEAGGGELQDEVTRMARGAGMRLLGPSSLGYADPRCGLILTANAAFADPSLPPGRLFAASHSGSMIGALATRGAAKGVGFAGLVSVGLEADLSLGEICEAALQDPGVDGFLLFLETLRHADALQRFALAAARQGKPVVAYKLGRSDQAAELAQSHTGAMAGEDRVADAFFRACGIVRLDTLDGFLEAPTLVRKLVGHASPKARPTVGVVTTTGGGAAMVVDQLGVRGVEVRRPAAETFERLAAAEVVAQPGRVVDLTMAGTRYEVMRAALEVMTTAPEFDLVVAVVGSSARFHPEQAVQPVIDVAGSAATPLVVFATPEAPEALVRLAMAGAPAFRTPESCADAVAAALRWRPPSQSVAPAASPPSEHDRYLDEAAANTRLEALGIKVSPYAKVNVDGAGDGGVSYPVAVKVLSADVLHKTDVGGVVLGVPDPAGLGQAIETILANLARTRPDLKPSQVLVQTMAAGVGEVLIGFRRDRDVGPVVLLAPGGVLAELSGQSSLRLAPVNEDEAREMIAEVGALRALASYRGGVAGDLDALADAIVSLSMLARDSAVIEAEINPLIIRPAGEGVLAVDALMRVREEVTS